MNRRTYLATTIAGVTSLGGCLEIIDPSTTSETDQLIVSSDGDYPHEIRVDNALNRDVTVTITVDRNGSRAYHETHTVTAQTREVVAGITKNSVTENAQLVTVTANDADGQSASINVSISDCLGNIVFFYESDGKLKSTYSIC